MILFVLRGTDECRKKIQDIEQNLTAALGQGMTKACILITNEVQLLVSGNRRLPMTMGMSPWSSDVLHVRSGRLKSSYTHRVIVFGREIIGVVGSAVKYAPVHEFGAVIRPLTHKFLRFKGSSGEFVFVKSVTIPARAPLRTAGQNKKDEIRNLLDGSVHMLVERGGKL